jgi:hypothetical protein
VTQAGFPRAGGQAPPGHDYAAADRHGQRIHEAATFADVARRGA